MHCKHCGNQIENDSKFCSFCGGKVEPMGQTFQQPQQTIETPTPQVPISNPDHLANQNLAKHDQGLLVAFSVMVGLRIFWFISDTINKDKSYSDLEGYYKFVVKPSYIIFWSVPLILALFSKRKEQKLILLIISLVIIGWTIYENFIKQYN